MTDAQLLFRYFPKPDARALERFTALGPLYAEWNARVNVISRKDIDQVYPHHILHALAIAKFTSFRPGSEILDLGTGGGIPGIPLAILLPEVRFTLIDGTRKKIKVVEAIVEALELENVTARHIRAEEMKQSFDFVVSRAVASLDKLYAWSVPLLKRKEQNAIPNGLIALKGGKLEGEIKALPRGTYTELQPIRSYFPLPYFEDKFVLYVQA